MIKQDNTQDIATMLHKFMAGETSLDEERALAEFFRTHEVSDEWREYKEMFVMFDNGEVDVVLEPETSEQLNDTSNAEILTLSKPVEEKTSINLRRWFLTGAACIVLLLGFFLFVKNQNSDKKTPNIAQVTKPVQEIKKTATQKTVLRDKDKKQMPLIAAKETPAKEQQVQPRKSTKKRIRHAIAEKEVLTASTSNIPDTLGSNVLSSPQNMARALRILGECEEAIQRGEQNVRNVIIEATFRATPQPANAILVTNEWGDSEIIENKTIIDI